MAQPVNQNDKSNQGNINSQNMSGGTDDKQKNKMKSGNTSVDNSRNDLKNDEKLGNAKSGTGFSGADKKWSADSQANSGSSNSEAANKRP